MRVLIGFQFHQMTMCTSGQTVPSKSGPLSRLTVLSIFWQGNVSTYWDTANIGSLPQYCCVISSQSLCMMFARYCVAFVWKRWLWCVIKSLVIGPRAWPGLEKENAIFLLALVGWPVGLDIVSSTSHFRSRRKGQNTSKLYQEKMRSHSSSSDGTIVVSHDTNKMKDNIVIPEWLPTFNTVVPWCLSGILVQWSKERVLCPITQEMGDHNYNVC